MNNKFFITCLIALSIITSSCCCPGAKEGFNYGWYTEMGNDFYEKGEYDKAIESYEKAVPNNMGDSDAFVGMGNAYYAKEDYSKAVEYYKKALELSPDNATIKEQLQKAEQKLSE